MFLKKKLRKYPKIIAADVGCGAGRYDKALVQNFGKRLFLYCVDANKEMLKQLKSLLNHRIKHYKIIQSSVEKIPLGGNSLDIVFTFNAIHHFPILKFFRESARLLRKNGWLFVYTRLRSQNRRNIWGKYFPRFNEKETRLYELHELKRQLAKVKGLKIESIEYFKYPRRSSLDRLIEQAQNHHYSTFYLYTTNEFENAMRKFKITIQRIFKNANRVQWFDENILLVVRKKNIKNEVRNMVKKKVKAKKTARKKVATRKTVKKRRR